MFSWITTFFSTPISNTLRNPGNHTQAKQNQEKYRIGMSPHSKIYVVAGGSHQDNLVPCTGPEKKKYISKVHRQNSFKDARLKPKCNAILKMKMEALTDAGFYYSRTHSDLVICFYCGGGLRGWGATDNPWIEHAAAYPDCGFTKLVRGERFIKACTELDRGAVEDDKWAEYIKFVETESGKCPPQEEDNKIEDLLCLVCFSGKREIVYMPCSHIATCRTCGPSFDKCIVCRKRVAAFLKVYY